MRGATPDTIHDEWLVSRARSGEADAFEALARRFQARLFRHALHTLGDAEVAADAVQEAWVAIARNLHQLDDPARFVAWAYRIVSNKCRDWLRKEVRRRRITESDDDALAAAEAPPPPSADTARARVRAGLARLPAKQRAILSMYYLDELSVGAIAEILGIPAGTVKSRLFNARRQLETLLEDPPC